MTELKFKTFKCEAIINFPKTQMKNRTNFKTKEETKSLNFSAALYFDKEAAKEVSSAYKIMKEAHPNAKSSLKTIKSEIDRYLVKANDENESNDVREKAKNNASNLQENLPKNYTHMINTNAFIDRLECINLYEKPANLDDIKSGDKVYVKVLLFKTSYQGKTYISNRLSLICKIKEKEVSLFSGESNQDAYDALKKYQTYDSDPENDDEEEAPWDEK